MDKFIVFVRSVGTKYIVAAGFTLLQLGPSSRHPEDLMPLLKLMAGPLSSAEAKYAGEKFHENRLYQLYNWRAPEEVSIGDLKVIVVWDQPGSLFPVSRRHKELVEAQDRVVQAFEQAGCSVRFKM